MKETRDFFGIFLTELDNTNLFSGIIGHGLSFLTDVDWTHKLTHGK
jgi:hypothetical protein